MSLERAAEYWQVVAGHRERRTATLDSSQASALHCSQVAPVAAFVFVSRVSLACFGVAWWLLGLAEIEMSELSRSKPLACDVSSC